MSRLLAIIVAVTHVACLTPEPPAPPEPSVELGAELYVKYCGFCHGDAGEGYISPAANALANPLFLAAADDAFLTQAIELGRPGTKMSPWGAEAGGPLTKTDVANMVAYIRTWETEPAAQLVSGTLEGNIEAGEGLYASLCATCHGPAGEGTDIALSLNNPVFLDSASDGFLAYAIEKGRPGTAMPAYETSLSETDVNNLVALIRSWQTPIIITPPVVLPKPELIINPDGPEPEFTVGDEFIGVDVVKAELDKGAKMILVDARPQPDYNFEHIKGAVNIPFFEIETRYGEIPEDVWVISYCGCPHDESGIVAATLRKNGHKKVAVLDEGYFVWKQKGYPVVVDGEEQGQ